MDRVAIILVGTRMPENIGSVARAMGNFGFLNLRLANAQCTWPNQRAQALACHATPILDNCSIFPTVSEAVADLNYLYATTVRSRYMEKPVVYSPDLSKDLATIHGKVGILFGPEDDGLTNVDMRLADKIVTVPTDSKYSSMNIAQAAGVICYSLSSIATQQQPGSPLASKAEIDGAIYHLEAALEHRNFFQVSHKKQEMLKNISASFTKAALTNQEVRTIRGIIRALVGKVL